MRVGRPRRCPRCGDPELADVLYGTTDDPALLRLWAEGRAMIRPGRCGDGPPGWMCRECGYEYLEHRQRLRAR